MPHTCSKSTLAEIEKAAAALPADQQQKLILFIAACLRADGGKLPPPRQLSQERMAAWFAEDEACLHV